MHLCFMYDQFDVRTTIEFGLLTWDVVSNKQWNEIQQFDGLLWARRDI